MDFGLFKHQLSLVVKLDLYTKKQQGKHFTFLSTVLFSPLIRKHKLERKKSFNKNLKGWISSMTTWVINNYCFASMSLTIAVNPKLLDD